MLHLCLHTIPKIGVIAGATVVERLTILGVTLGEAVKVKMQKLTITVITIKNIFQ